MTPKVLLLLRDQLCLYYLSELDLSDSARLSELFKLMLAFLVMIDYTPDESTENLEGFVTNDSYQYSY